MESRSVLAMVTKPKPRDLPVAMSVTTVTSEAPYSPKVSWRTWSSTPQLRLPGIGWIGG